MAWTREAKENGDAEASPSRASHTSMASTVGNLCADLPEWVVHPPIEAVCFAWGVSEDGQLVRRLETESQSVSVLRPTFGVTSSKQNVCLFHWCLRGEMYQFRRAWTRRRTCWCRVLWKHC